MRVADRPKYVWVFDPNRRKYRPAPPGHLWSKEGAIWREHWVRYEIIGETTRSWLDAHGRKYPKGVTVDPKKQYSFDEGWIDREAWVSENRHKLVRVVETMPFEKLAQLAELIEYDPPPPDVAYRVQTRDESQQ